MEETKIRLNTYSKVWKIENKIYAIYNIILPLPVSPRNLLYFGIVACIVFILSAIFTPLKSLHVVLRYAIVPYLVSRFLLRQKLDGRSPHRYFVSWVAYMLRRGQYIERFQQIHYKQNEKIRINWNCTRGPAAYERKEVKA